MIMTPDPFDFLGAGLEACTTRMGLEEGGGADFHGVPLPVVAPLRGSFLEGLYRFGGRDARFLFAFCLGLIFGEAFGL
jgi:hypothetical protein